MRALAIVAVALALTGLAGCPDEPGPPACVVGDPTQPIELALLSRDGGQQITPLHAPMTAVPLVVPEQGGQILLVGVRARNLDGCSLMLTTSLRDPCTDEVLTVERRPVLLAATADGWAEPAADSTSQWGNLAVCPNAGATRDLQGQRYLLRVAVEADDGRTAETSLEVVPTCAAGDDGCLCQCQAGYDLGDECPSDLEPGTPTACPAS